MQLAELCPPSDRAQRTCDWTPLLAASAALTAARLRVQHSKGEPLESPKAHFKRSPYGASARLYSMPDFRHLQHMARDSSVSSLNVVLQPPASWRLKPEASQTKGSLWQVGAARILQHAVVCSSGAALVQPSCQCDWISQRPNAAPPYSITIARWRSVRNTSRSCTMLGWPAQMCWFCAPNRYTTKSESSSRLGTRRWGWFLVLRSY